MARGTLRVRIVGDASDLQRVLGNATGRIGTFARRGVMVLGAAVAGAAVASVRAFANFDQAMTNSLAIMGDVSDTMRVEMSDAAREVAKTTQFSATQAAESYFFLASAGLDAAASIEALPRVAAFAQAGQFDMARATDLLTDAQSALGLAVDDTAENIRNMTRVSDVLVGANTLANASVEQFSESLTNKAGAAMRNLGMDIEEGVAVLAVYADQGRKGSEAGTMLNATLEGLTRTARENADAYAALNVSVFDSSGEMRNMADIVGDLEGAFDGMSTEQQLAELATLGLTRQARDGIIALLGSADAVREYEGELRSMGGVTEDVASKQMETFWAQLGLLKDQFIDLGISIGERLVPPLMDFVGAVQDNMPLVEQILGDMMGVFAALFGSAEESFGGSADVVHRWGDALDDRTGQAAEATSLASSNMRQALESVSEFITGTLIPAAENIRAWWDTNGPRITRAARTMGSGVVGTLTWISDNWTIMRRVVQGVVTFVVARWAFLAARSVVHAAVVVASWASTSTAATVAGVKKGVAVGIMVGQWATLAATSTAKAAVVAAAWLGLPGLIAGAVALIGVSIWAMIGWLDDMEVKAGSATDGLIRAFANMAGPAGVGVHLVSMIRIIRDRGNEIVAQMASVGERIKSVFRLLPGIMRDIGASIITGLISGITGQVGRAVTAAIEAVNRIVRGARRAADVRSPSGEGVEIGAMFMRGIALGIVSNQSLAEMAARDAIGRMTGVGAPVAPMASSRTASGGLRHGDRLRLVVDGHEFNAYVDARMDERIDSDHRSDSQYAGAW